MLDSPTALHDLRTFFRAIGNPRLGQGLQGEPAERTESAVDVELVETERAQVRGGPLNVVAFVDGVQSSAVVTHREHRPVYLTYQAAGAVGAGGRFMGVKERLTIVCSTMDREWVDTVNPPDSPLPVTELLQLAPPDVERAAWVQLGERRESLERVLIEELVDNGVGPLACDGSLIGRPQSLLLHGVVKSTRTKYYKDETVLYGMPQGWRSPMFRIPSGSDGCPVDRYSCYVRLHDARFHAWTHGLIRLKTFDPAQLDALAAPALVERQSAQPGDCRWDRHRLSVATTEKVLRSRRPDVFDL